MSLFVYWTPFYSPITPTFRVGQARGKAKTKPFQSQPVIGNFKFNFSKVLKEKK